ncbi:MAG: hypothetical protein LBR80_16565 [Deltaproteobacteria bacterium]|jgi:transposase-like protein|nr:hypothetical protein [Deltaproteobacteria bacterium]
MSIACPRCGSPKTTLAPERGLARFVPGFLRRWLEAKPRGLPCGRHRLECKDCGFTFVIIVN